MADQDIAVVDFTKQFNHGIGTLEVVMPAHVDTDVITVTLPDNAKVISYKVLEAGVENNDYTAEETPQTIVDGVRTNGTLVLTVTTNGIDADAVLYVTVNLG